MPRLRAQQALAERGHLLTPEAVLELTEAATGDRDLAEQAYCDAVMRAEAK